MAVRKILIWPHPILSSKSKLVENIDDSVKQIVNDIIDTMRDHGHSAGLAAPQIGESKRLFVVDIPPEHNDGNGTNGPEAFINPEIIHWEKDTFEWEEACLSIPGQAGTVTRTDKIILRYTDINGTLQERKAHGYLSGCFQHELDHLNGIVWVNHKSRLVQNMIKRKMEKYQKATGL